MAHTVALLSLIDEYPEAFLEPSETPFPPAQLTAVPEASKHSDLMALVAEFPEAFEHPQELFNQKTAAEEPPVEEQQHAAAEERVQASAPAVPSGYQMALHQSLSTFGWGTVDVFLQYKETGLQSIWFVVGKSGTEVQSFCEAIACLTNRLLAVDTPISELVRELRGIRGGDSEGLGPHRFLGLVDLFGKVLQEAPERLESSAPTTDSTAVPETPALSQSETSAAAEAEDYVEIHQWLELSDLSAIASICPECGAELQQVNGCSGGACIVCGYSSCS